MLSPNPELEGPLHDCHKILSELTTVGKDLRDVPLCNSDLLWFTDGSSFMQNGLGSVGVAVVDQRGKWCGGKPLHKRTSAQKAELIALTEALKRAKGKLPTVQ